MNINLFIKSHFHYLTTPYKYGGVDLLRAIAIIFVFVFHIYGGMLWIGVDLFFVLSGFLIGGMIYKKLENNSFKLKTFYIDRLYRIMPVYISIVIATMFLQVYKNDFSIDLSELLKYFFINSFFLHSYSEYFFPELFSKTNIYAVGGSWSLVVEQFFYLFIPILLIVFHKIISYKTTIKVLISFLFFAFLFRLYYANVFLVNGDYNWMYFHFMKPHFRMDELLFGVVLALLVVSKSTQDFIDNNRYFLIAISVFLFYFIYSYMIGYHPILLKNMGYILSEAIWLPTLLALMFTLLLASIYKIHIKCKIIIFLARLSYPIYLVHILLMENHDNLFVWIVQALIISYLLSLFIEYPFLRLYKKI